MHAGGNIILYISGISCGLGCGYMMYVWLERGNFSKKNYKVIVWALRTIMIAIGFIVGFVFVVFAYTLLHIIFN